MKIKRIGTLKTLRQYEKALLERVFPKYIAKADCEDQPQEILAQIRLECHNPFFMACALLDEADTPVGFFVAFVQLTKLGKRLYIDHMYAPNTGQEVRLFNIIRERLGVDDVMFLTRRDPDAWIKMFKRAGVELKLHGYLLHTVQDMNRSKASAFAEAKDKEE
jgi:hypothetical protein